MDFKPRLSGENSILGSLATVAVVASIYNGAVGPVADVHATDPGDININSSISKAGWTAIAVVGAIGLLAKDLNIFITGGGTIIFEEISYRHANMTHPGTGKLAVTPASYQPAGAPVDASASYAAAG